MVSGLKWLRESLGRAFGKSAKPAETRMAVPFGILAAPVDFVVPQSSLEEPVSPQALCARQWHEMSLIVGGAPTNHLSIALPVFRTIEREMASIRNSILAQSSGTILIDPASLQILKDNIRFLPQANAGYFSQARPPAITDPLVEAVYEDGFDLRPKAVDRLQMRIHAGQIAEFHQRIVKFFDALGDIPVPQIPSTGANRQQRGPKIGDWG